MSARSVKADDLISQLKTVAMSLRELSLALQADEDSIKPVIADLLSRGRIALSNNSKKKVRYKVTRARKAVKEPLNTSVASAPSAPLLKGEITGYTNEIRERVELAMLGRGRA